VSILKREKLLEVPVTVEKIRDLIRVLTSVWMLKVIRYLHFILSLICLSLLYLHTESDYGLRGYSNLTSSKFNGF
jgi:hypothetical protein